ncbi:MAG TPA: ABC transporter substrate-binding protein [Longimicrobiales bacterium]|nr:ABC transporter substrate-binding protein [Longimicrobiales bacterium]
MAATDRRGDMTRSVRNVMGLALAALMAACGGGDGGGGSGAGGTVVAGMQSDFSGLNPITNSSIDTDQILKYGLYTPLIQYDEDFNPRPYLAESWEEHGDTAVTFTLREDVKWHDGRPVTAEDVKFTFDMAKAPEAGSLIGSAYLGNVASATVVDARTIRFSYSRPHAQALEDFWWAPVPKHALEGIDAAGLANASFNRNPVGSGPFRFVEWRANERLVLERNDSFPEALGGPPAAQRIVFRVVPEPATLLTELLTGGVQVDIPVEPDQTNRIKQTASVTLYSFPGNTLYYLGWNNQRPPFDDARVRRAMTLGINRQEIIDALLFGYGRTATSTVPPWHPFHPDIEPLPHDPDQARQLLQEAGWTDGNGDGVREKGGRPLRFSILTSERPLNRAIVEVLQSQLRGIGADVQIQVLEFQTMLAQHKGRDFDAVLSNWVLDNFQMASAPFSLFHSSQAAIDQSANRSGVRIPRLDALIDRGAAATDADAARAVWREFTEVLQEEQPFTFMFWRDELAATSDALDGFEMDQRGEFQSMTEWSVR